VLTACGPSIIPQPVGGRDGMSQPGSLSTKSTHQAVTKSLAASQQPGVYKDPVLDMASYCDPYYYDPYCGCPDYDPYCEGLPPPPPNRPLYMTYTPYTESSSMVVSWTPDYNGYGATYYELQRYENGIWNTLYTDYNTAATLGISGAGAYTYRVRACNDGGCSDFLTDNEMRASKGPARSDVGSQTISQAMMSTMGYEPPATLGVGFDNLREEMTANTCLDMSTATNTSTPARTKEFHLDIAHSREELSTLLSLTQNLSVTAKYGKLSGNYSGKKELLSTSSRVDQTYMVVASLRDQFSVESINNPSLVPIAGVQADLLRTGQSAKFRNRCGDGYVYSIAHGRQYYLTFQLNSFDHSQDDVRTQTQNLKLDIGGFVSASYDSTQKTQITQKYSGYNVKVYLLSYGSSVAASSVVNLMTLDQALQFMKDFEAEPVTNGSYPIDYKTADYEVPSGVTSYPDYHPYRNVLQRWYSFDQQIGDRCELFDESLYPDTAWQLSAAATATGATSGLSLRDACFYMKRAVQENINNCEDTSKWSQCIAPDSSACIVPQVGAVCLAYANRFPYWAPAPVSLTLDGHLDSGFSRQSLTVTNNACLPSTSIRDNRGTGSVDCAGTSGCPGLTPGVAVTNSFLFRADYGWNSWNDSSKCLHSEVTITRPNWWGGSAKAYQVQTVNGLSPQSRSYLF